MFKKDFSIRLEKILSYIDNIKDDTRGINFQDYKSDRRRQDAVLFNFTKISWLLKKMEIIFPNEMSKFPERRILRLKKLGDIIDSYGNDHENTWLIITEELAEYELLFNDENKNY